MKLYGLFPDVGNSGSVAKIVYFSGAELDAEMKSLAGGLLTIESEIKNQRMQNSSVSGEVEGALEGKGDDDIFEPVMKEFLGIARSEMQELQFSIDQMKTAVRLL